MKQLVSQKQSLTRHQIILKSLTMKYLSNIFTGILSVFFITTFAYSNKITRHEDKQELPPVETYKPNTNYQPAVKSHTRIPDTKTADSYIVTIFTNKLSTPPLQ